MKKTNPVGVLAPTDAVQILQSAVSYCQKAGIGVSIYNTDHNRLILIVDRVRRTSLGDQGHGLEFIPQTNPEEKQVDTAGK